MIYRLKRVVKTLLIASLLLPVACSSEHLKENSSPYDRLCAIYEEELGGKEAPGPEVFQRLSNRIDYEVPELKEHHGHLANVPKEELYPTLKSLAESETGSDWECIFISDYYRQLQCLDPQCVPEP